MFLRSTSYVEDKGEERKALLPKTSRRKEKLTIAVIALSNLCAWSCISLLAPFFPIEAEMKGASETIIGMLYSCSELVLFLFCPLFGYLMSVHTPRFFYITGLCVFGTCDVLFGWLDKSPPGAPFIGICFAVRIIEALGTASIMTASFAITGSNFPDRIGTVYSILETVSGVGFLIGPAIGGGLYEVGGFGLPFWVLGACVFLCGCGSMILLPAQPCAERSTGPSSLTLLRSARVWYGSSCLMASMIGFSLWSPVYAQRLQEFDLSQSVIGLIFIIPAVTYSLTCPLWGVLLDKNIPPLPLMTVGLICFAVVMLFFGPAPFLTFAPPTLWLSIVSMALIGLSAAPLIVSSMRSIVQGARDLEFEDDSSTYGLVGGIVQSSNCLGTFLGPLVGGALTDLYGFGWMATIGAFMIISPVVLFSPYLLLTLYKRRKYSSVSIARHTSYTVVKDDTLL